MAVITIWPGKLTVGWGLPCIQSNALILYLLCATETISSSQNYFSDIKKTLHGLQKSDSTGNWSSVPAIIENYPHLSEHENKGRKGREREREKGWRGQKWKEISLRRTQAPAETVFQAVVLLAGSISWDCTRKIKCQALSHCNLSTMSGVKENVPWTTMNMESVDCTSEVQWILAQNELSKYAYGLQGETNRIYRTH